MWHILVLVLEFSLQILAEWRSRKWETGQTSSSSIPSRSVLGWRRPRSTTKWSENTPSTSSARINPPKLTFPILEVYSPFSSTMLKHTTKSWENSSVRLWSYSNSNTNGTNGFLSFCSMNLSWRINNTRNKWNNCSCIDYSNEGFAAIRVALNGSDSSGDTEENEKMKSRHCYKRRTEQANVGLDFFYSHLIPIQSSLARLSIQCTNTRVTTVTFSEHIYCQRTLFTTQCRKDARVTDKDV